jgi:hypothetical protein
LHAFGIASQPHNADIRQILGNGGQLTACTDEFETMNAD